jgi:RNA polymerase primary sigma factor
MRSIKITPSITSRNAKSLDKYLYDISKFDVLQPEEEYRLFSIRGPEQKAALRKIIQHNLRFVVSVSKKYQHCGLALSDLINEGNVGLIKAAHRFDETRGFKFISYAVWWIRQSIIQAINEKSQEIRSPLNLKTLQTKILEVRRNFSQSNDREPTKEEISDLMGLPVHKIAQTMRASQKTSSLDRPAGNDTYTTIGELCEDNKILAPDHHLTHHESNKIYVKTILQKLPQKHRHIVSEFYGLNSNFPKTLRDIAEDLDLSKERVRQIRDRAISKLRTSTHQMEFHQ